MEGKRLRLSSPDQAFCSMILSLGMLALSSYVFYSNRHFTDEYFSRQMVYLRLEKNPYNFINYN